MARVFITGSADGLGFLAGKLLLEQGHQVMLHARNEARAQFIRDRLPGCGTIAIGDVSTLAGMHALARQTETEGRFDAVIHNVGLGINEAREETEDGFTRLFAVNVVAPYVLTAVLPPPNRLIYLCSGMHLSGEASESSLRDPQWKKRLWQPSQAYSDTKLLDWILTLAVARLRPQALANAVDPGWVPTRMGGPHAPDDLREGAATQVWLAVSEATEAKVSGHYFYHKRQCPAHPIADDPKVQEAWLDYLRQATGVTLKPMAE